jgi:integrase
MPVVKLTQEGIAKLRCPDDKRSVQVCDAQHRGLLLELRRSDPDRPTWYVRYKSRDTGKTRYVRLGFYPGVSLADARVKAKDVQSSIWLGSDPRAEEDARKAVPTFSEFFEEQYIPYAKTRKRTWKKDLEYFNLRLSAVFNKRLNVITRREIQLFHSKLRDEGLAPATCNHYLKLLKRVFNLAIQWEIFDGPNPAVGIQQYKEMNLKETYLDDQTLPKLLSVIKIDKNKTVCFIILFLLSTGARLNEALQARWEDIDIEKRVWRIPASTAKSGRSRAIALNEMSIDVLNGLDTKNGFEYLFINKQTGRPYTTIQKVWNRLRKKAGLGHIRIHDLRHSYASYLINSGFSLFSVSRALGHSNPLVTQRYAHLSSKSLQDAADSASDVIKEAMKEIA